MASSRRDMLQGLAAAATVGMSRSAHAQPRHGERVLTPEQFGARGDGATNDTAAFAALAAEVNRRGGGTVVLRKATYIVGRQRQLGGLDGGYAFEPDKIMEFVGCTHPLRIRGNGALIRCAPGLRYGTFDPRTGAATNHSVPFYDGREIASPYRWMIKVEKCTGPVEISKLELDGNATSLVLGGLWGDTGRQIPAIGLGLYNNLGSERITDLHAHHHGLDGVIVDGLDEDRPRRSVLSGVRSEYNGRQGCSIVGGRGYDFVDCQFNHTGRAGIESAPGAGVDIEAENKKVRDLTFRDCEFVDNRGADLLADQGDSERASFTGCRFVATTMWAAWPLKPYFRFDRCTFVGPICNAFGDAERPERATVFTDCIFRDDPALSPTGIVYIGQNQTGPIADFPTQPNVRFRRCDVQLTHRHVLPWTSNSVIFEDCTMSQRSTATAYPRGIFIGRNRISAPVDMYGARVMGELILNGKVVPPTG
jgi:hypothetical protein